MKGIFELDAAQPPKGDNVLLVDALNLAFRYKHKRQRNFAADYVRTVESFAKSYDAPDIIICADKGSSTFRKEIFPEYKGNRAEKYKDQTDEEKLAFQEFLEDFEDAVELCKMRFPLLRFKGVEADDIISVLCQEITDKDIWIISTDRDFDQLITGRISRFCYYTRKEIKVDNFYDKYDCTPEEYISLKVLQGDSGDNVPGVAGVGAKRAAGLIREYGSAFDIYDNLPLPGKAKYIQNVNAFGDQLLTNYKLMDLSFSTEAVGTENLQVITRTLNEIGL
jgi:5'-3' exonuclease